MCATVKVLSYLWGQLLHIYIYIYIYFFFFNFFLRYFPNTNKQQPQNRNKLAPRPICSISRDVCLMTVYFAWNFWCIGPRADWAKSKFWPIKNWGKKIPRQTNIIGKKHWHKKNITEWHDKCLPKKDLAKTKLLEKN